MKNLQLVKTKQSRFEKQQVIILQCCSIECTRCTWTRKLTATVTKTNKVPNGCKIEILLNLKSDSTGENQTKPAKDLMRGPRNTTDLATDVVPHQKFRATDDFFPKNNKQARQQHLLPTSPA